MEQLKQYNKTKNYKLYLPSNILLTSRYGSQTVKPRPIRSMAARLNGV